MAYMVRNYPHAVPYHITDVGVADELRARGCSVLPLSDALKTLHTRLETAQNELRAQFDKELSEWK